MATPAPDRVVPGWMAGAIGRALYRRLAAVAPTVRVLGAEGARARFAAARDMAPNRRVFLYYWIEDAVPLMLYALRDDGIVDGRLRFVCDDTLGGRVVAEAVARLGHEQQPLRLTNQALRVRDVQSLILEGSAIGIAADGRGPYRFVSAEMARLVRRCEAVALPLAVQADRSFRLWARATVFLPRANARLAVAAGEPVAASPDGRDLRSRLQEGLAGAGALAREQLASGNPERLATASGS